MCFKRSRRRIPDRPHSSSLNGLIVAQVFSSYLMNPSADTGPEFSQAAANIPPSNHELPLANWREALMALIATRVALFELESLDLAHNLAKRVCWIAAACCCVIFTWALLLVGGISLISEFTSWPWNRVAIGIALIHLLVGLIFARGVISSSKPAFSVTRAEFKKDREWIENFHKAKKSND